MKKIYLTESQMNYILMREMVNEGVLKNVCKTLFKGCSSFGDYLNRFMGLIAAGILTVGMAVNIINNNGTELSKEENDTLKIELAEKAPVSEWRQICDDCVVTVYNAVPAQCNKDVQHTASMFKLNLNNVAGHKIIAMERTMMKEFGLNYGDVVKIEGTYKGKQDGVYQIQDTMNKRFAGQHKIDVLVPNNIKTGGTMPNQAANIYILNDKGNTQKYLDLMSPSLKEMEFIS